MKVKSLKSAKVMQVYSGLHGCMCGCRGKHFYRAEAAGPGYEVERNDSAVHRMVRRMNRLMEAGYKAEYEEWKGGGGCVFLRTEHRDYVAYFK